MLSWAKQNPRLASVLIVGVVCAILFLMSLLIPIMGYLCSYDQYGNPEQCSPHHLGPYVVFLVISIADAHNGLITAIATILLTWITYMLVQLGREQSNTTRSQLRAYVCAKSSKIENFAVGQRPKATIVLENVGQTPAYRYRGQRMIVREAFPFPHPLPINFEQLPGGAKESDLPARDLGTGGESPLTVELDNELTQPMIDLITEKRAALYLIGVAYYDDIFGDPHETHYCLYFGGDVGARADGQMASFKIGNSSK